LAEEDVITVVVLAIKLRIALILLQLVTIVNKKAMSLEIAKRHQNPKNVTSVIRKATFLVIVLMPAVEESVEEAVEEAEEEVENATNVEKSGISPVHAQILLVMVEGTVHSVVAMVRRLVSLVAA